MNWSSVNCINDKLQQLIRHSSNGLYEFILISSSSSCPLSLFQYQAQETNVKSVFFTLFYGFLQRFSFLILQTPNKLSVSLFRVFRPSRGFFHSYGDVTITGEGLQILTYTRHLWPLWSESSLACQTYCDTHPFKWSCAKTSDTHAYWLALSKGAITTCACFNDLGLSRLGFEHSTFRMQSECSF